MTASALRRRYQGPLNPYLGMVRLQSCVVRAYRMDYVLGFLATLAQIYLLRVVWRAVYGSSNTVEHVSLAQQISYSTIVTLQVWLFAPSTFYDLTRRVREGSVAMDMLRPVGFLPQVIIGQAGNCVAVLPLATLSVPFAILFGGVMMPASPLAGFQYIVALVLGWLVACLMATLVGMLVFWTLEVSGAFMTYQMIASFLGGALVPLWFMPGWLRSLADLLPFKESLYTPLAIYLGRVRGSYAWILICEQIAWAVGCAILLLLVWSRALRRVTIQGG